MANDTLTRGARVNADISALLRARHTLLWVTTREETRVERALIESAAAAKYETRFWDCATGITNAKGDQLSDSRDPGAALEFIRNERQRAVYVLRDLHGWLRDLTINRMVRSLAKQLENDRAEEARSLVVLTPDSAIPMELAGHATAIEYPLPDRAEVAAILDDVLTAVPEAVRSNTQNGVRDAAVDAAVGLSAQEIANCYSVSAVTERRIDPAKVRREKCRVIAREKVLTVIEPDPRGMDAIGGLALLKDWLRVRRGAFSPRAREFGLPAPKGVMLVGPPGTGKSLTAKCIASAWGMPLLRLDMGSLRSKWVGESEGNIRKALNVAEAMAPCVLWLDEIEKALGGASQGAADGGVSADALGAILSWMQEKQGSVFVVGTANDVRALPPELLRKGRFDELFFVELPTRNERREVLAATLRAYGRDPGDWLDPIAGLTEGFSGAELAALVPDALFSAFNDGERALTTDDLAAAAKSIVPLSKTAGEKLEALREWAKSRARPASAVEERKAGGRALDV